MKQQVLVLLVLIVLLLEEVTTTSITVNREGLSCFTTTLETLASIACIP